MNYFYQYQHWHKITQVLCITVILSQILCNAHIIGNPDTVENKHKTMINQKRQQQRQTAIERKLDKMTKSKKNLNNSYYNGNLFIRTNEDIYTDNNNDNDDNVDYNGKGKGKGRTYYDDDMIMGKGKGGSGSKDSSKKSGKGKGKGNGDNSIIIGSRGTYGKKQR
jgi:hypothetical protein